ncbi:hypothetical protein VPH35_046613 [Triticum aestivum]
MPNAPSISLVDAELVRADALPIVAVGRRRSTPASPPCSIGGQDWYLSVPVRLKSAFSDSLSVDNTEVAASIAGSFTRKLILSMPFLSLNRMCSHLFSLLSFASLDGFEEVFLEMSGRTGLSWVLPVGERQISCSVNVDKVGEHLSAGDSLISQLLAGLSEPTSGSICIQKYDDSGNPMGLSEVLAPQRVGIVFQFPERYFLSDTILEEVTFGWPRQKADIPLREQLTLKLQNAINSVGQSAISLDKDPQSLSGGFKRRLALAIQLVQTPDLLLLDEPLAGLDWKARADVMNLLRDLKKDHTILVVSHDLRELYPLVDRSWRMEMGGVLKEEPLPV